MAHCNGWIADVMQTLKLEGEHEFSPHLGGELYVPKSSEFVLLGWIYVKLDLGELLDISAFAHTPLLRD